MTHDKQPEINTDSPLKPDASEIIHKLIFSNLDYDTDPIQNN